MMRLLPEGYICNIVLAKVFKLSNLQVYDLETERGVLKGPKLTFNQRILRDKDLILSAIVTVVLINPEGKPRRFPRKMLEHLGVSA